MIKGVLTMIQEKQISFAPGFQNAAQFEDAIARGQEFIRLMSYYSSAMLEMETKFKVLNIDFTSHFDRNPIESIHTRLKRPQSIIEKLQRRGLPITLESMEKELSDIAGVRVICSFVDDIYRLVEMLEQQDDIRILQRKDYIANPKPGGYRSLHLIVEIPIFLSREKRLMRVEVQFRTIAMDFWASLEHKMRYKKDLPEEAAQDIAHQLLDCANTMAQMDEKMLSIRKKLEENDMKEE